MDGGDVSKAHFVTLFTEGFDGRKLRQYYLCESEILTKFVRIVFSE